MVDKKIILLAKDTYIVKKIERLEQNLINRIKLNGK